MKTIELRDYLMPGGRYPYSQLFSDLESALARGESVMLVSVAGHWMGSGHPGGARPWSDGDHAYKTARDFVNRKNGRKA